MNTVNCKATVGCLVRQAGKLLMVLEDQHGVTQWDIPAGQIEQGEHPDAAIRRELLEETGLVLDKGLHLASVFWTHLHDTPTIHFLYDIELDANQKTFTPKPQTNITKVAMRTPSIIKKSLEAGEYEHHLAKHRLDFFLNGKYSQPSELHLI